MINITWLTYPRPRNNNIKLQDDDDEQYHKTWRRQSCNYDAIDGSCEDKDYLLSHIQKTIVLTLLEDDDDDEHNDHQCTHIQ